MQSSPGKEMAKEEKKIEKQKVKMYIFSTEYIFLKSKDQTNEHEQIKNQMNHKNKDVHVYSKYRLVFIFYIFLTIFIHNTNT